MVFTFYFEGIILNLLKYIIDELEVSICTGFLEGFEIIHYMDKMVHHRLLFSVMVIKISSFGSS